MKIYCIPYLPDSMATVWCLVLLRLVVTVWIMTGYHCPAFDLGSVLHLIKKKKRFDDTI